MNQKELEKYIATRPSAKESDGAWKRFVDKNKRIEQLEKLKNFQHPAEKNNGVKYVGTRSDKPAYIEQHPAEKYYEGRMNEIEKKGQSYLVKHLNKTDPVLENRGKQTVAINHTANKVLNNQVKKGNIKKEDLMLQPDKNGLLTNKSKTIAMRDSFMAKQFNNALGVNDYPTEATPEQFGKLAERLEKDRQMRGAPTNVERFEKNFNNINSQKSQYPGMKTWEKKKISKPTEPVKIDLATYTPFVPIEIPKKDPEYLRAERNFNQTLENNRLEKERIATTGIAGLVGGDPKYGK